ncbi:MAG: methyltransferase domain-containing protein [wastewater metagenome]|nr:methyltransferase domain-containing protein [Candidatus Loosdrechtia aerotolerans]
MKTQNTKNSNSSTARHTADIFRQKLLSHYKEPMSLKIEGHAKNWVSDKDLAGANFVIFINPGIRILLIFELLFVENIDTKVVNRLQELTNLNAVDQTILFTFHNWGRDIRENIKHHPSLHIVRQYPEDVFTGHPKMFSDFYYTNTLPAEELFRINAWVDVFMLRLKKIFHLVLSEYAAETYDESYGKANFATQCIKDFEEKVVADTLESVPSKQLVMDIGCGTGRHSFLLLDMHKFHSVIGFDFSPKMIEVAQRKKNEKAKADNFDLSKITFMRMDVEDEEFSQEQGSADLVCASFGMGSFVENIHNLLKKLWLLLKDEGILIISFYNKNGIQYQVNPVWRDSSLSAKLSGNDELKVNIGGNVFTIYCKPYEFEEIRGILNRYFGIINQYSFPTLSAFMPNSIFAENQYACKVFKDIDAAIAQKNDMMHGAYFLFICKKEPTEIADAFHRIKDVLNEHKLSEGINYEVISHEAVVDFGALEKVLNVPRNQMVKTILVENKNQGNMQAGTSKGSLYAFAVPGHKKLDMKKAAKVLGARQKDIRMVVQKQLAQKVESPVCGIASFLESGRVIPVYFDEGLRGHEYLYTPYWG